MLLLSVRIFADSMMALTVCCLWAVTVATVAAADDRWAWSNSKRNGRASGLVAAVGTDRRRQGRLEDL